MATQARLYIAFVCTSLIVVLYATYPRRQPVIPGGCGPTSLFTLSRQLGIQVSFEDILARFDQKQEASFAEIQRVANTLGLPLEGREMTVETLQRMQPLGILHLDGFHFV